MKNIKIIIITIILLTNYYLLNTINGQVGINADGSSPNASSMLDVKSTTKGILIPRLTTTQRNNINAPATGLMIYNSSTNAFNFYNGTVWIAITAGNTNEIVDADNDTKIQVEKNADEDIIRFDAGGVEYMTLSDGKLNILNTGHSVFMGENAGLSDNKTLNENTFVGSNAGASNTNGYQNAFLGRYAGNKNVIGGLNTFIGAYAGRNNTVSRNTFIGAYAGHDNTTGTLNTFIGLNVGLKNTTGNNNTFAGNNAGQKNTIGSDNTFYGYESGHSNTSGNTNMFLGKSAGYSNTTGSGNTYIGNEAGYSSTTAASNVAIGTLSGYNITTALGNLFLGLQAGYSTTTGDRNLFLGAVSGYSNVDGIENTYIGIQAGALNTSGSGNIFIGNEAGYNETGSNKLFIENSNSATPLIYGEFDNDIVKIYGTLGIKDAYQFPITDGTDGQVLKTDGSGILTWTNQIAARSIADADGDTKIQVEESADEDSIRFDIMGSERFVFRQNSGGMTMMSLPNTYKNIFIGEDAGLNTTLGMSDAGTENLFIGYRTGYSNTTGAFNTFIGNNAGYSNTSGNRNLFLGRSAGYTNTTGLSNTFIGERSGYANTTGNFNLFIGENSGGANTTGRGNMFIGGSAGGSNITGEFNVFMGTSAGFSNTAGNNNVYLGMLAGVLSTGSGNVFLGHNAGYNEMGSNKLYIENSDITTPLIYGEFDNNIVQINGTLKVVDGNQGTGKILVSDANGQATWTTFDIPVGTPDPTQPVPIEYQGVYIYVHPTDNASDLNWADAQTTCNNLTAFGKSDWYLPTRLELDAMYKQSYRITGLSQTEIVKYWSSTAKDATYAYTQRLDYGGPDPDDKVDTTGHNCRCIRKD